MNRSIRFLVATIPITVLCLMAIVALSQLGLWYRIQTTVDDAMTSATGAEETEGNVVIVAVDDTSIDALKHRWPWPRTMIARLVERIAAARPAALGVDLLLLDPDSSREGDAALAKALSAISPKAVVLERLSPPKGDSEPDAGFVIRGPIASLRPHVKTGFYNLSPDSDHVIRRQRLVAMVGGVGERLSFAHQIYRQWVKSQNGSLREPYEPPDAVRIAFRGPPGTFPSVSAHDVIAGRIAPATFHKRVVLIGATFADAKDVFPTPMRGANGNSLMDGVEIHANTVSGLIAGRAMSEFPARDSSLCVLVMLGVVFNVARARGRRWAIVLAAAFAGLSLAAYVVVFLVQRHVVLPLLPFVVALALSVPVGAWLRRWYGKRSAAYARSARQPANERGEESRSEEQR